MLCNAMQPCATLCNAMQAMQCYAKYKGKWEQFKTDRPETHPNPEGNGDATLDFFRAQFDFSARETAAIMGAHTIGRMTMAHSLFKYTWTVRGGHIFNNAYYKTLFGRRTGSSSPRMPTPATWVGMHMVTCQ